MRIVRKMRGRVIVINYKGIIGVIVNDIKVSFFSDLFLDLPHLPYDVHDIKTVSLAIFVFFVKFVKFTSILYKKPQSFEAELDDIGLVTGEAGQA